VDVRNPPAALVVAHDKLLTARTLRHAGLPHPHTTLLSPALPAAVPELPLVLKPRFGSWGRDVELCSTSDELDAALARRAGLHLAAFSVTDAAAARQRLTDAGFPARDLVRMQRPVETENGPGIAAFTIARVAPMAMPEGRIQILTHHTEDNVWQPRWLSHPNSVCDLIDVVIAVGNVEEAAQRFARFAGRPATFTPGGALIRLDRGGIYLVSHDRATEKLPEVPVTSLPFMIGYALGVESLAAAEAAINGADLEWRAFEDGIVATFPADLGQGAWFFVEAPEGLPWRR